MEDQPDPELRRRELAIVPSLMVFFLGFCSWIGMLFLLELTGDTDDPAWLARDLPLFAPGGFLMLVGGIGTAITGTLAERRRRSLRARGDFPVIPRSGARSDGDRKSK